MHSKLVCGPERKRASRSQNFIWDIPGSIWSEYVKGRSLQCGFWPRNCQVLIWNLLWICGWIFLFLQGKRPKISSQNSPGNLFGKIPSNFCRSLFLRICLSLCDSCVDSMYENCETVACQNTPLAPSTSLPICSSLWASLDRHDLVGNYLSIGG